MRRALLSALVVLASLVTSAAAAPSRDQAVGILAYRTTTDAGSLDIQVVAPPRPGRPSFVGTVMTHVERSRVTAVSHGAADAAGTSDEVEAWGAGHAASSCEHGYCYLAGSTIHAETWVSLSNPAGSGGTNVVFIVARGPEIRFSYKATGWAVKRVPLSYRWVSGDDTASVAVHGRGNGVEVFDGEATLPGGRFGSVAVATAPCSESTSGLVSRGIGTMTLNGGRTTPSLTCPTDDQTIASYALHTTAWRAAGTVAGDTNTSEARLFVLDLPKTLAVPKNWPWR